MCRHVKIEASESDLKNQGITCPLIIGLLLSGQAFPVEEIKHDEKPRIYLGSPFSEAERVWVYEEFVRSV